MTREEFIRLYEKFLKGECSPEEQELLFKYEDDFRLELKPWNDPLMGTKEEVRETIWNHLTEELPRKRAFIWRAFSGIAAVLISVIAGIWWMNGQRDNNDNIVMAVQQSDVEDIMPGSDKAILILGDGTSVKLDTTSSSFSIDQYAATVKNANGKLVYEADGGTDIDKVVYNAIATPKGGQYKITLADGTNVWLNAGSYLKYPTQFAGNDRTVVLKGEGYFDVAHNAGKPFKVRVISDVRPATEIMVTGTEFNVNAYDNEINQAITLVNGSVQVSNASGKVNLKPGEVALVSDVMRKETADVDEAIAWKENRFQFNDESLISILRQLERWYDIEIDYSYIPDKRFFGIISRDVKLSQVLKMLQNTGEVKFSLKNQQLSIEK